jgi:hypothetical protein
MSSLASRDYSAGASGTHLGKSSRDRAGDSSIPKLKLELSSRLFNLCRKKVLKVCRSPTGAGPISSQNTGRSLKPARTTPTNTIASTKLDVLRSRTPHGGLAVVLTTVVPSRTRLSARVCFRNRLQMCPPSLRIERCRSQNSVGRRLARPGTSDSNSRANLRFAALTSNK